MDVVFVIITIAFFGLGWAYVAACERIYMGADNLLGLGVALLLTVYLVYALVRAEKF